MRSCKTRRPYLGAAFWQWHGVTGSKPRGEQWKSSAVYKMTCEGRGKNQGCLVSRKQLRSHNSLQICKRERITGLVLQEGREFLFAKHVNWEVKHRHRPRRGLWNLPQWHFLRINCKSWGVDPFAGWGCTRWPLKHPLNLKLRITVVRKSVFTDSWCSNSLQKGRHLLSQDCMKCLGRDYLLSPRENIPVFLWECCQGTEDKVFADIATSWKRIQLPESPCCSRSSR